MKIKKLAVRNFRSIKSQDITFEDYSVFVGPNSSGKSTFLHALNVFFGEIRNFTEDDFWNRDTANPIEISVTFFDFSEAAADVFKHYIRHNEMTVTAEVVQNGEGSFQLTMMGERLVNREFARFFDLPKSPVSNRKAVYEALREKFDGLPSESSGAAMEAALREFEEAMPENEKEVLRSADEFFGVSKGADKFRQFITWVLDSNIKCNG
jgi:putative ATP-dependent endonuclease of OLD family